MSEQDHEDGGGHQSCFTVYAGGRAYGVWVYDAQTIFKLGEVTPVPMGPADVAGLTNLRGRVMTVVSLQQKLGTRQVASAAGALAIGLSVDGEDLALVVDQVGEVITTSAQQRLPVPQHFDALQARVTEGLYRVGDGLLPVLNVRELVASGSAREAGDRT